MTDSPELLADIRTVWTRGAEGYDHDVGHGLLTPGLERVWAGILTEVLGEAPLDVLDVGTGTGLLAVQAAKLGHHVTGLDLTPAMLEFAAKRATAANVAVEWREGDAMATPFNDGTFDVTMSRHVLWTMPVPRRAFQEWIRVTRPGGKVVWFDSTWPDRKRMGVRARAWASGQMERMAARHDHHAGHHYSEEVSSQLPLRGVPSVAPIRQLLRDLGVMAPRFWRIGRLRKEELRGQPLYKRIAPGGERYIGLFEVTPELREANRSRPSG
jgi:ubiquinone/menaquinone biosynthesis C-methylase UbiE